MKTRYLIAAAQDVLKVVEKRLPAAARTKTDAAAIAELRRVLRAIDRDQYKGIASRSRPPKDSRPSAAKAG